MRSVLITVFVVLSCLATVETRAQEVGFTSHLSVNAQVEAFTNILVSSMLPELIDPKVTFARDQSGNVINEMSQGKLAGNFSADLPTIVSTPIGFDFSMDMEFVEIREKDFYQINLKTQGVVNSPTPFFDYVFKKVESRCQAADGISPGCRLLGEVDWQNEKDPAALFWLWKEIVLADVAAINDPRFESVKAEFLNYLDNQIVINQEESGKATLSVELGDMAETFRDKNNQSVGKFLNDNSLIDYAIPLIKVSADQAKVNIEVHLIKYHRVGAFNDIMEAAKAAQGPFEDLEVAVDVAESLQSGSGSIRERVLGGFSWMDRQMIKAGYAKTKILGSNNTTEEATDEELDLGLD